MNTQNNERYLQALEDIAYVVKTYAANYIWKDLKIFHPKEYNELLLAALEQLPK